MTNEEILAELRTIRTLLALEKEEELNGILNGLDEVEQALVGEIDDEWGSLATEEIAEECDVGERTVRRRVGNLEEIHLIERQGNRSGTKYRETGLLRAAELITSE
ncbi:MULTISPECIES: DeoR family transcriptional regulator [Haloarcula]|uniref:DeoR family transcriptional regulator n=1 Tax=Haloarcula TaxID=2237 RepID=UPI0023E86005|nr:DeoR family transcriptional regulator [Halomicroarcula sp. SHR3]